MRKPSVLPTVRQRNAVPSAHLSQTIQQVVLVVVVSLAGCMKHDAPEAASSSAPATSEAAESEWWQWKVWESDNPRWLTHSNPDGDKHGVKILLGWYNIDGPGTVTIFTTFANEDAASKIASLTTYFQKEAVAVYPEPTKAKDWSVTFPVGGGLRKRVLLELQAVPPSNPE